MGTKTDAKKKVNISETRRNLKLKTLQVQNIQSKKKKAFFLIYSSNMKNDGRVAPQPTLDLKFLFPESCLKVKPNIQMHHPGLFVLPQIPYIKHDSEAAQPSPLVELLCGFSH